MKTIVFIGCNKFGTSNEALIIAKQMGYYVALIMDKKIHYSLKADQFIYIKDLFNIEKSIDAITKLKEKGYEICACLSFIDPYISYSAKLAKHFGLMEVSINSLYSMENKIRFREKLKHLSSSPFYTTFHNEASVYPFIKKHNSNLPLIVKPPSTNGSRDVFFVETEEQLKTAVHFLLKKYPKQSVLVEEYLLGPQYLIEVFVQNNNLTIIGIIEQEFSEDEPFIVIGYQFPASLSETEYKNLIISVREIIGELELTNGACHLEMRNVDGEWKLIEINPRMSGGVMNRIIEEGTGINLIKDIIKLNLGKEPSLMKTQNHHVYARYVTLRSRGKLLKVTGEELALKYDGVKYVFVKPLEGDILTAPSTMGHRYACIIAASQSPNEAKSIALAAAMEIKFYLEPF